MNFSQQYFYGSKYRSKLFYEKFSIKAYKHTSILIKEGQDYLNGMAAAANFAWVNRSSMTFLARQAFSKMFHTTPDDLDMHVIYDVSHNIAKMEVILI